VLYYFYGSTVLAELDLSLWSFWTTFSRPLLDEWSPRSEDLHLAKKKTPTRYRHPCAQQDSNQQSHTASCRRPTPWTAWPLGFAKYCITPHNCSLEGQGQVLCVEKQQNVFNRSSQVFLNGACLEGWYNGCTWGSYVTVHVKVLNG